eukprot:4796724-Prymnesium_polylepis.1
MRHAQLSARTIQGREHTPYLPLCVADAARPRASEVKCQACNSTLRCAVVVGRARRTSPRARGRRGC